MRLPKTALLAPALLLLTSFRGGEMPHSSLKSSRFVPLRVPEPSDVARDAESGHLFIVSDNGFLYETDANGTILRRAEQAGWDFEGVEVKGNGVYVSDESARKIYRYDKHSLLVDRTYEVPYHGARNSGFESIAWNESKGCFILVSEQDPVTIYEYSEDFRPINQQRFMAARDVSSARWWDGKMYLLSDEDEAVYQLDPKTYAAEARYGISILNPEGLAFESDGRMLISADDRQRLYFFNALSAVHE